MISSRTEYAFVSIPSSIKVNGEIMPLRSEPARNELRGEDPAFVMEAMAERAAVYNNAATSLQSTMTREIRGDRLQSVANVIRDNVAYSRYVKPFPSTPVYDLKTLDLADELNLHYTVDDLQSSPSDVARGQPLDQSRVLSLFHDVALLSYPNLYFPNGPYFGSSVSFSYSYSHDEIGGYNEDTWEAYGRTIYDYRMTSHEMTDWDGTYWYGGWKEATASGGNLSFSIGEERAKWIKPVSRVICICSMHDGWTDGDESHDSGSDQYAAFSCSCTMTGSTVTLDVGSLVDGAKSLLAHYGFVKRYKQIHGSQTAYARLVSILPVCEMGEHTRW